MYLKLLNAPPHRGCASACNEQLVAYTFITERHIQAMWLEQKYFKNLCTTDGRPIEVVSPGIWNAEAGPDFLKAHLRINGADYLGDIEIHLSDDSWYTHGHHTDAAYDRVVLHVGYWTPKKQTSLLTSQGHHITTVHLEKLLTVPEARLLKLIDLDLYPYHRFSGSGRCARELFSKLPVGETVELLSSAALWRLKQKWMHLESRADGILEALFGGIASALGYKHNSRQFFEVFRYLVQLKLHDEQQIFAEAMAMCGFFDEVYRKRWFLSPYYQRLAALHDGKCEERPRTCLQLDHIRPANHPVRRLAYLAALLVHKKELMRLPHQIEELWRTEKDWKKLKEGLSEIIPMYDSTYWIRHYAFEEEQKKDIGWIGAELRREIVVNVWLPYLFHCVEARGNKEEIAEFANFYASLKATSAKKTDYLTYRFFGEDKKEVLMSRADMQQGAYQIHKDFCIHYEASCEGCPFVSKYRGLER